VVLKLECLFYLNIYLLFYLILYSKSHFDSNKSKKRSHRKKTHQIITFATFQFDFVNITSLSVQAILEATNCFKDACAYKYFCFSLHFLIICFHYFSTLYLLFSNLLALKKVFSIIIFIRFNKRLKTKT